MKQTSITKLSEIYNALLDPENARISNSQAAEMIQEVIRAEASTPVKGSKFDIFNFVGKDSLRPVMCGVFHDDGWRVASDLHILYAERAEYPEEYEHKILLKDGSFVEYGVYPKWRSIIPDGKDYEEYEFDAKKFYGWIEQKRIEWKAANGRGTKFAYSWKVKVGPAYLKAEFFDKFITAMKEIGATKILIKDYRRMVYAKTDKGCVLLMPIIEAEDNTDTLTLA